MAVRNISVMAAACALSVMPSVAGDLKVKSDNGLPKLVHSLELTQDEPQPILREFSVEYVNLALLTPMELSALINQIRAVTSGTLSIQAVEALLDENMLLMSPAEGLKVLKRSDGVTVAATYDGSGRATLDPIYLADENGDIQCTVADRIGNANQGDRLVMAYEILLDISGSMAGSIGEVVGAAQHFVDAVAADHAQCRISVFGDDYTILDADKAADGWKSCHSRNWQWKKVQANGGGTKSFNALSSAFIGLHQAASTARANGKIPVPALIVVTDGMDDINRGRVPTLQIAKSDIPLFTYFEDASSYDSYSSWADMYYSADVNGSNVGHAFSQFLNTVLYARVIDPAACNVVTASAAP